MAAINTTLSTTSAQCSCPVQHGLGSGDIAAIIFGSIIGVEVLIALWYLFMGCLALRAFS